MGTSQRAGIALALMIATLVSVGASAELNLYISHHFAGIDRDNVGSYQNAAVLLEAALAETRKSYRKGDTLDALGQVNTALGKFDRAEEFYGEALRIKKRRCNLGGPSLINHGRDLDITWNNLADVQYIQGKTQDVEGLYRKALDFNKRDQLNIEVCRSLNGLAVLRVDNGDYVEAEELLKRAIRIHEKAERRDHPYLATVLTNLGILYTNLLRFDEAEPLFERAKYIQDLGLRADHPDVAVRLHATAVLYHSTGRPAEAAALAGRAEAIREKQAQADNLY